jgi:hypothetical protein
MEKAGNPPFRDGRHIALAGRGLWFEHPMGAMHAV